MKSLDNGTGCTRLLCHAHLVPPPTWKYSPSSPKCRGRILKPDQTLQDRSLGRGCSWRQETSRFSHLGQCVQGVILGTALEQDEYDLQKCLHDVGSWDRRKRERNPETWSCFWTWTKLENLKKTFSSNNRCGVQPFRDIVNWGQTQVWKAVFKPSGEDVTLCQHTYPVQHILVWNGGWKSFKVFLCPFLHRLSPEEYLIRSSAWLKALPPCKETVKPRIVKMRARHSEKIRLGVVNVQNTRHKE